MTNNKSFILLAGFYSSKRKVIGLYVNRYIMTFSLISAVSRRNVAVDENATRKDFKSLKSLPSCVLLLSSFFFNCLMLTHSLGLGRCSYSPVFPGGDPLGNEMHADATFIIMPQYIALARIPMAICTASTYTIFYRSALLLCASFENGLRC